MKSYQSFILTICIIVYLVVIAIQSEERHRLEKERLVLQSQIVDSIASQHQHIIQTLQEIETELDYISANIEERNRGLKK